MTIFEQLRPFISLCQACGMMPFTIEENLMTNKFAKFTFSFRHRTTWWFFLILLLQPVIMFAMWYMTKDIPTDLLYGQDMPITVTIMLLVSAVCSIIELLLSRWIVLQYRKLRNAIEAVQEVERLLGKKLISLHQSSVTTRFIIGFILATSQVVSFKMNKQAHYTRLFQKCLLHKP
jgi:gustatory receptor